MKAGMHPEAEKASTFEVFMVFLMLGLTSFGGPIAHLGYFKNELLDRRRWLSEAQFAELLAVCQFLPGPASSQLGFCLGLLRAGWRGALAAFFAFTMPSVVLLLIFASVLPMLSSGWGEAVIHGLKLVACVIVADAIVGMSKKLCPDLTTRVIAIGSTIFVLWIGTAWVQLIVVAMGATLGGLMLQSTQVTQQRVSLRVPYGVRTGAILLSIFFGLLITLPFISEEGVGWLSLADVFYRAGALVFGGGHVVLPLLQESVVQPGWISAEAFLSGYGAAQAIPGPMFSFAAYLGAMIPSDHLSVVMALVALLFIFLPGFLLVAGVLPFWDRIATNRQATGAVMGINAVVVGLLVAALYNPVVISSIFSITDAVIVLVALAVLLKWRVSPLLVVVGCVLVSLVRY